MPNSVANVIVLLFGIAAVCALSVAIPQSILFFRLWRTGEAIAFWTLKTILWTGSIGLALGWRCLIFLDFVLFDQRYMGSIDERWPIDAFLAVLVAAACLYAAVLYHATVTFSGSRR